VTLSTSFGPVERRTVADEIRERIAEGIRSGELQAGERLPAERQLCEQFQVARTSVREAIQGLVSVGYLERRGNRPYVAERLPEVTLDDDGRKRTVRELFETRRVIELQLAEMACERATPEQRARIVDVAADFRPGMALHHFRRHDRAFHSAIADACGNSLLNELYRKVLHSLFESEAFASLLFARPNRAEVSALVTSAGRQHQAIAAAIEAGDPVAVVAAAEEHLSDVEERMLKRLV
jgi:GntR family transcriptional repressor for pyruvate dehydrogenase complex